MQKFVKTDLLHLLTALKCMKSHDSATLALSTLSAAIFLVERAGSGWQIHIGPAGINVHVGVPDPLERVYGRGSTHEAAAEVALGLACGYAEAPDMHTIVLVGKD